MRVALAIVGLIAVLWCLGDGSPVGHFALGRGEGTVRRRLRQGDGGAAAAGAGPRSSAPATASCASTALPAPTTIWRRYCSCPGRAAPTPVWADNLPGFLALRSVYTIDLLGEPGLSIQDRPLETDADQAAWLHEVIAQLPEPAVHVVGLSIGGWTAMNLAVHRPQKIASLTLIEPVFVFTNMSVEAILRSIPASVPWLPRKLRDDFNSWTAGGAPVEHEPVGDMIEAGMAAYRLEAAGARPDRSRRRSRRCRCPCWSSSPADRRCTTQQAAAAEARRLLPRGTIRVYAGASHAISGEHPGEIAADVAALLDRSGA